MNIIDYLKKITSEKYRTPLLKLYADIELVLKAMPAAIRWHHSEEGGLYRHTNEVISIALDIYNPLKADLKKRAIIENDVIIVAFTHDLEKTIKYKKNKGYEPNRKYEKGYKETAFLYNYDKIDMNDTAYVVQLCARYGIFFTDSHLNALTYSHGGWSVDKGELKPLATILHAADLISSSLYKNGG